MSLDNVKARVHQRDLAQSLDPVVQYDLGRLDADPAAALPEPRVPAGTGDGTAAAPTAG